MPSLEPRSIIVILAGLLLGASLLVTTGQRLRTGRLASDGSARPVRGIRTPGSHPQARLHPLDAAARLALGASLLLLALSLLAARLLWSDAPPDAVPGWVVPLGAVLLAVCALAAAVAGAFALGRAARRRRVPVG